MHDLGKDIRREWGHFAGLEHHCTTDRQCWSNFAGDLVHRPVPRRNQTTDSDGFFNHSVRAKILREGEVRNLCRLRN